MKRIFVVPLVLAVMLMLSSCSGIQINISEDALYTMERMTARSLAYKMADEYPEWVDEAADFCVDLIGRIDAGESSISINKMVEDAKEELAKQLINRGADPLITANVSDVLRMITFDSQSSDVPLKLPPEYVQKVRVVAAGFLEGLMLQQTGRMVTVE